MNDRTLAIIKPDAVRKDLTGKIYNHILTSGFNILSEKSIKLDIELVKQFYLVHKDRPFYDELTQFMSSGRCMVLALSKVDAVNEWRVTIGNTNPKEAEEGTIRALYGTNVGENAVHGSDSDENAIKEISFFFSENELI